MTKFLTQDQINGFKATPYEAVLYLLPHISNVATFIEPCAGAGDLVNHLRKHNRECDGACDIAPKQDWINQADCFDFLKNFDDEWGVCGAFLDQVDAIITNPPFSRPHTKLLFKMIDYFAGLKPTWLLLPLGFAANINSAPSMAICHDMVTIGRLIWHPGTTDKETRDMAWFHFDKNRTFTGTIFHPYKKPLEENNGTEN